MLTNIRHLFARHSRWLVVLILAPLTLVATITISPSPAAAAYHCADGVQNPNNHDVCYVYAHDFNFDYIVDSVTGLTRGCDEFAHQTSVKVHVVGEYEAAGDKFHFRSIGIRYLAGVRTYAWTELQIYNGNGVAYNRPFNYNGDWNRDDPARLNSNDTTNFVPPASYSPPFGAGVITLDMLIRLTNDPTQVFGTASCDGGHVYVTMRKA